MSHGCCDSRSMRRTNRRRIARPGLKDPPTSARPFFSARRWFFRFDEVVRREEKKKIMFSQLRSASLSEVDALESALPDKIMKIDGKLASLSSLSLEEVEARFTKEFNASGPKNAAVAQLLSEARSEAATCILNLSKYERFIVLSVPKVEDGNNFGVSIQLEVKKFVGEQKKAVKDLFDKCADYHKDRASLLKDIVPKQTEDKVEGKTQTTDNENKNKESTNTVKESLKTSSETKTTTPKTILPDAAAALVALDVSWYFQLYFMLEQVRDSYIACGDTISKNRKRLEAPKGDGNSGMSMF